MNREKQRPLRLFCTFCGAEITLHTLYWHINDACVCQLCLPEFARHAYHMCRQVRGKEAAYDAD